MSEHRNINRVTGGPITDLVDKTKVKRFAHVEVEAQIEHSEEDVAFYFSTGLGEVNDATFSVDIPKDKTPCMENAWAPMLGMLNIALEEGRLYLANANLTYPANSFSVDQGEYMQVGFGDLYEELASEIQ